MTTIVETITANFADNSMPVLANDSLTTVGTDFIFDALNPACYAGGALPAVGAAMPVAGLVNLARDSQLALARTGPVTAVPIDGAKLPTFDGKGLVVLPGTKERLRVVKSGVANNRVGEAVFEGFKNSLFMMAFRLNALPGTGAVQLFGAAAINNPQQVTSGGAHVFFNGSVNVQNAGGGPTPVNAGSFAVAGAGTVAVGALVHVAVHYAYDTTAGTCQVTSFVNGVQVDQRANANLLAAFYSNYANADFGFGGGFSSGWPNMNGVVHRFVREYTGISGLNAAAVAALVAKDYANCAVRFA